MVGLAGFEPATKDYENAAGSIPAHPLVFRSG